MQFKEYLEYKELQENFDFINNEGIGSALSGLVDAGISGVGTTGKQVIRGIGNIGAGGVAAGASALGSVFGSPDSRKKSKSNLVKNLSQIGRGAIQTVASVPAGLYRGWEAGRDPFAGMKTDSGSGWGELMGVRKKKDPDEIPSWEELYNSWRSSKDANEKANLLSLMKKYHNEKYEKLKSLIRKEKELKFARSIFGFSKNQPLSEDDIKQRYRMLSKKHHPDVGGSKEDFIKIHQAFLILIKELNKNAA